MKRVVVLLALCIGFSLAALAQYGSSSSSPQGSTSSSDQSTTSKKSKKSSSGKMSSGKEHTVTGCLSGPNDEGVYVLTNGRYKKGLEVGGNDELKNHVGHKVKLTGTWVSESELGAKEPQGQESKKEAKEEAKEKHMKVAKIDHIADTCTPGAKAGKSKKEKSSSAPPSM